MIMGNGAGRVSGSGVRSGEVEWCEEGWGKGAISES